MNKEIWKKKKNGTSQDSNQEPSCCEVTVHLVTLNLNLFNLMSLKICFTTTVVRHPPARDLLSFSTTDIIYVYYVYVFDPRQANQFFEVQNVFVPCTNKNKFCLLQLIDFINEIHSIKVKNDICSVILQPVVAKIISPRG